MRTNANSEMLLVLPFFLDHSFKKWKYSVSVKALRGNAREYTQKVKARRYESKSLPGALLAVKREFCLYSCSVSDAMASIKFRGKIALHANVYYVFLLLFSPY